MDDKKIYITMHKGDNENFYVKARSTPSPRSTESAGSGSSPARNGSSRWTT